MDDSEWEWAWESLAGEKAVSSGIRATYHRGVGPPVGGGGGEGEKIGGLRLFSVVVVCRYVCYPEVWLPNKKLKSGRKVVSPVGLSAAKARRSVLRQEQAPL